MKVEKLHDDFRYADEALSPSRWTVLFEFRFVGLSEALLSDHFIEEFAGVVWKMFRKIKTYHSFRIVGLVVV